MAEINIQRKKKPVWPWIILMLVIVAAAALWYFNSPGRDSDNPINATGYRPVSVPQMRMCECSEARAPAVWTRNMLESFPNA